MSHDQAMQEPEEAYVWEERPILEILPLEPPPLYLHGAGELYYATMFLQPVARVVVAMYIISADDLAKGLLAEARYMVRLSGQYAMRHHGRLPPNLDLLAIYTVLTGKTWPPDQDITITDLLPLLPRGPDLPINDRPDLNQWWDERGVVEKGVQSAALDVVAPPNVSLTHICAIKREVEDQLIEVDTVRPSEREQLAALARLTDLSPTSQAFVWGHMDNLVNVWKALENIWDIYIQPTVQGMARRLESMVPDLQKLAKMDAVATELGELGGQSGSSAIVVSRLVAGPSIVYHELQFL
ncbi:hypothetical protein OF83DRAFT_1089663 [Amylostereum chailletii]|nr:hypothetical protein OF83DRAFT_1089663 [Amylostereum chailletii]